MEAAITMQNIGKKYAIRHPGQHDLPPLRGVPLFHLLGGRRESFWALRGINLDIQPGERVGIIGRNGAGKSTLLKLLARITEPSEGHIVLRGRVAGLLEVGTGFHGDLTGRENIYLNGAILGMRHREIKKKFDEIVAFSGVEKFLDTPIKRYSSGMHVRLGFAVAAHLEPDILIVDEVLAVGDAAFRKQCMGKMGQGGVTEGRTVLFVSHDLSSIRMLCTRVIWLQDGQVVCDGMPDEVTARYERSALGEEDGAVTGRTEREPLPGKSFYIAATELRNARGELCTRYEFGDKLELRIFFTGQAPADGFTIEYIWYDEMGNRASAGCSYPLYDMPFDKNTTAAICVFDELPLTSGSYRLYLSARIRGLERWDEWDSAARMRIVRCDPGNTGQDAPCSTHGPLMMKQQWKCK